MGHGGHPARRFTRRARLRSLPTIYAPLEASEDGFVQVEVRRNLYFEGRVCATLTARSGSAIAGEDFRPNPTTVCWGDQDTRTADS